LSYLFEKKMQAKAAAENNCLPSTVWKFSQPSLCASNNQISFS